MIAMKLASLTIPRKTGRPRSFDRDAALEQAMLTFWRHGYETTSIVDLTTTMGVTAPSLYAAFGDKKQLFLEAMRLYAGDSDVLGRTIDDAPTSLESARTMLMTAAVAYTGDATPRGCLLASATASGSSASADVQDAVAAIRRGITDRLCKRIARDVTDGLLPKTTNADALAGLVMAVTQGMSVLARDGAARGDLLAIVDTMLVGWPGFTRLAMRINRPSEPTTSDP
jgi:AcrR family transcriptional regulator